MNQTTEILDQASKASTWMGALTLIAGILAMASPLVSGVLLTYMIGFLLILGGISRGIYAFYAGSLGKGILMFAFGAIAIIAGLVLLSNPVLGLTTLTLILFGYFLVDGVHEVILAFQLKPNKGWGLLLINGLVSLLLAVMVYRHWPVSAAWLPGVLVGVNLILTGITMLAIGSISRNLDLSASGNA